MTILRCSSRFTARAAGIRLQPDRAALEPGYQAATRESWRADLADTRDAIETEDWPA